MENTNLKTNYRKNITVAGSFIIITFFTVVVSLALSYDFTRKFVREKFDNGKLNVLDSTIADYKLFICNDLSRITEKKGIITKQEYEIIAKEFILKYSFVSDVSYFDMSLTNDKKADFNKGNLGIDIKFFEKLINANNTIIKEEDYSLTDKNHLLFDYSTSQLLNIIENLKKDTSIVDLKHMMAMSYDKIVIFSDINKSRLGYYKDLINNKKSITKEEPISLIVINIDSHALVPKNIDESLYQNVSVRSLFFDSLANNSEYLTTEIALPNAFSGHKLYFITSQKHLSIEIYKTFLPFAISLVVVYFLIILIAFLISKNLAANKKIFKLQYDFINNLTHEFKTPLSVIKIAGDNIRSSESLTKRECVSYGRIMNQEADKLNNLITRLLSYSQLENGSITLKNIEIILESFIQEIASEYRIKYPDFNISVSCSEEIKMKTDPVLLNILFSNMVDNAYKYSYSAEKVLDINIFRENNKVVIYFKDKGIGIDSKDYENIFKKFYRVDNNFNKQGSVGIGLAFCKEIVDAMNGSISVTSKKNLGSMFKIVFRLE